MANRTADLQRVMDEVEALLEAQPVSAKRIYAVRLALDELLSNVIHYAYDDAADHPIGLRLETGVPFALTITDDGKPFNPLLDAPPPVLDGPLEDRPIGGLGLHILKQMGLRMTYRREAGHNILRVEFPEEAEAAPAPAPAPVPAPDELEQLRSENARLKRDLADLEMLYETTTDHGEAIEDELAEKNIALEKIQARLQEELNEALRYVMSLLPEPMAEPLRAEWRFIPSSELGGDSFGYHWIDPDHLAVYLLDVCGHGVGAALLSVTALNTLRGQTLSGLDFRSPGQVLTAMGVLFDISKQNEVFFTLSYGVYHRSTRELTFASGGHHPAILVKPGPPPVAECMEFLRAQPIIGMVPGFSYQAQSAVIPAGSRLFVFSDGAYELPKKAGGMFSLAELGPLLARYGATGRPDLDGLVQELRAVQGRVAFDDDFSMLVLDL